MRHSDIVSVRVIYRYEGSDCGECMRLTRSRLALSPSALNIGFAFWDGLRVSYVACMHTPVSGVYKVRFILRAWFGLDTMC